MTKKLVFGCTILVALLNCVLVGCGGGDPGQAQTTTAEEIKNDPAVNEKMP